MKRGSRYIAMFLIYLVIIPVIYVSNAMAYFTADASGFDRIPGFRRMSDDVTIINVTAELPDETVASSQIKLLSDPTRPFECNSTGAVGPVSCEMTVPGVLPPGPHFYEVQLFHADLSEAEPKSILTVYVDNLPPKIHSFSLSRNGSDVIANYQLSDSACDACSPDICAGISRVEFLLDYGKIGEVFPGRTCLLPGNSTTLAIPPASGTVTKRLCVDVYDALGQKSSECREIVMDFSPPRIVNASLLYAGRQLRYTKGEPVGNVQLQAILFEESELNVSSLVADLSALNARPEYSNAYKNIDLSESNKLLFDIKCNKLPDNLYGCSWSNLLMILPSTATPEIRLSALDNLTNRMNESYTLPIVFDNTRPAITSIRSGIADARGRYWIGAGNNTVYVDITESGSGFYEKRIFLDVGSFGSQPFYRSSSLIVPLNCTEGWTCVFPFLNVVTAYSSGAVLSVSLLGTSTDDAGNPIEGSASVGFYYDQDAPQILSIQNSSICPTAPNDIEITINVSERYSGGVKLVFSAPNISSASFPQTVDCEETAALGIWTCDIVIGSLVTIYTDGAINLTLEDRAGNRNTTMIRQEVCEAAPGVPPNVVRRVTSVNLFPASGIDRFVAGKIPFPLFWQPSPKFNSGTAQIQDIKVDSCVASFGTISDAYIVTPLNMADPIFGMKVSIPPEQLSVAGEHNDSVEMHCKLAMIIRSGQRVYQEPEIEEVVFEVPLYNTVFGELNDSMQRKLKEINQSISDLESEISDLEDTVEGLTWFCTVIELVMKLTIFLQVLKIVAYALGWVIFALFAPWGTAGAYEAGGNVYYWPCLIADYVTTTTIMNLWQIDFNPFALEGYAGAFSQTFLTSPGVIPKLLCGVFTCRLTEVNNFIELYGHAFGDNLGQNDMDVFSGSVDGVDNEGKRPSNLTFADFGTTPGRDTVWQSIFGLGDEAFSAYRSYPLAKHTSCLPAQLYAKKKERQITCMHRTCYRDMVSAGFSPEICEKLNAGRECLYVDGAAYRIVEDFIANRVFAGILENLLNQLAVGTLSWGMREIGCGYPYGIADIGLAYDNDDTMCGIEPTESLTDGAWALLCGSMVMSALYIDLGDWVGWDDFRNAYLASLGNPDYCNM